LRRTRGHGGAGGGVAGGDDVGVLGVEGGETLVGGREDAVPPTQLGGQVEHRDQYDDVEEAVFDERDQRGCPQAAGVGIGGQHDERDEERQVLDQPAVAAGAQPHHL
jgi:hypothetical protein